MKKKKISPELIILIIVSILCLFLPSDTDSALDGTWLTKITGTNHMKMIFVRLYFAVPFWWGAMSFFLLRSGIIKLDFLTRLLTRKKCIAIRVITVVLLLAMIYWTYGFTYHLAAIPPMPWWVGIYIMTHRYILGIGWCIAAVLGYLSLRKNDPASENPEHLPTGAD